MSLARTALRLAAIAALEADPVVGVLCSGRIFDSRIDELDSRDPVPLIVVYTEDDTGKPWSANNGGPPFDHSCDLLLEISMRAVAVIPSTTDPANSQVVIGLAETDAELEATLDLLEDAAVAAVTIAETPQATLIRKAVTRRTTELRSVRYAAADTGAKIAMRLVTLGTHLKIDQPDIFNPPTGPMAALPDPLRTVALSLNPTSSGYATCAALAARLTAPAAPSLLAGVDVRLQATGTFNPAQPPTETDPTASDPIVQSIDLS